jgi:hypothetical protein
LIEILVLSDLPPAIEAKRRTIEYINNDIRSTTSNLEKVGEERSRAVRLIAGGWFLLGVLMC